MYTQCPECGVAFRVTAEVLKMAAGKVRCGGCGVAFNALEHLSEQKPAVPVQADDVADPGPPEIAPEKPGELEADTPPQTISAEQSAALLKTLDQLAGEDIRIEDTGVEWRVLDDDDGEAAPIEQGPDEPSRVIDEMLFDDNTVLPDDFDEVVESPAFSAPAEPPSADPEPEAKPEAPQFDLDLSEPDEWEDLLGDFDEAAPAAAEIAEPDVTASEDTADAVPDDSQGVEDPLDMDTQFAIQAEAMGIDLSGMHEMADEDDPESEEAGEEPVDKAETSIEEDLIAAAFEAEEAPEVVEEAELEEELELEDAEQQQEPDLEIDLQVEEEEETDDDVEDIALGFDNKVEEDIATLSMSLDEDDDDEVEDSVATTSEEHVIPEMSEEEMTINKMIDEELFNIAVADEEGFASTIVQLQPNGAIEDEVETNKKKSDKKDKKKKKKDKEKKEQPTPGFETIIMEGELIRGEFDGEQAAASREVDSDSVSQPAISIPLNREKDDYARRREDVSGPTGAGIYAAIAALVLLLFLQGIHQSREALATVPAFNSAVGPVYRMLGQPLTPTWNIAGWRFEATKGDTDESGELLTIYSRIGNNSDAPLPYPLVHLSLTDRFEDVIGSTVLDPAEFLPENADPRKLVPPGNTFNAVISIDSPAENATGFKLNVCYRLASGQLRCADHDFK